LQNIVHIHIYYNIFRFILNAFLHYRAINWSRQHCNFQVLYHACETWKIQQLPSQWHLRILDLEIHFTCSYVAVCMNKRTEDCSV